MHPALEKTLVFLLLIAAGYFLQRKIDGKRELAGIKVLILSVILPATIFVALLQVSIERELLWLPILALALNAALYFACQWALPHLGFARDSAENRTMLLLLPSLAPGLSCFPFLLEYLGEESLALAALADVGNKVFVLIILYLLAMHWYAARHRSAGEATAGSKRAKLKDLALALLREPVNLVILLALGMLSWGLDISALPVFLENTATRLAALMTPIVLLFIGMAIRFERREMALIVRALAFRAGVALLLSAGLLYLGPGLPTALALLAVVFPQSAVSFWPFAHLSAVEGLGKDGSAGVFAPDLALNVLACSLPFSTVIILGILSCGDFFAQPSAAAALGLALLALPLLYAWRRSRALPRPAPEWKAKALREEWQKVKA